MLRKCVLLYVEPTPYILPLIARIQSSWSVKCETYFITRNASQDWGRDADADNVEILRDREKSLWSGVRRQASLVRKILSGHYSVAHLAGWGHPILLLCIFCLKLRGIPFSLESDTQLATEQHSLKERLKRKVYPTLFNWPKAVLPGGKRQAAFFRFYGVPEDRIRIAHMTVDVERIRRLPTVSREEWRSYHSISADEVVFLFVGRLESDKGIQILIEAFSSLMENQCKVRLVIIGSGSLLREVEQYGSAPSNDRVVHVGRKRFGDIIQWMRASDCSVVPSLFEPWGLVVNEAMACGLPIIASDCVGALDDLLLDGTNGLIVPGGDVMALARAMEKMLDQELRTTMGLASLEMIGPWTIEREASTVRDTLDRLVDVQ